MQFLSKNKESDILKASLVYKPKGDNTVLRDKLIAEQFNYCAYTEKYLQPLEQVDVEHFDSSKKNTADDNYYNYYAVITTANKYKKDEEYVGASFFTNKFFQNKTELDNRIGFANNIFYEKQDADTEARDFIDFLGLNHPKLSQERKTHIKRMTGHFTNAGYGIDKIQSYFKEYPSELSFITALNVEFDFDFTKFLN